MEEHGLERIKLQGLRQYYLLESMTGLIYVHKLIMK